MYFARVFLFIDSRYIFTGNCKQRKVSYIKNIYKSYMIIIPVFNTEYILDAILYCITEYINKRSLVLIQVILTNSICAWCM